jgi:hypothetical protein
MSKVDLAKLQKSQYQHSFHADTSKPPIALTRLGHITTTAKRSLLASLHLSSSSLLSPPNASKPKTRSPFVKKMPWHQSVQVIEQPTIFPNGKQGSEVLSFDLPPPLSLVPLERLSGAVGQG